MGEIVTGPKTAQTLNELSISVKSIIRDAVHKIVQLDPDHPHVICALMHRHWPSKSAAKDAVTYEALWIRTQPSTEVKKDATE